MNAASAHRDTVSIIDRYQEQEHDIRAALFGIAASAEAMRDQRHRLTERQTDDLAAGLVADVRRLRSLLEGRHDAASTFDLADAIAPVVASASASGLDVRSTISKGLEFSGRRDSAARVVLTLLDNARQHAGSSPVEVRASSRASHMAQVSQ